jgi:hypothetical protein
MAISKNGFARIVTVNHAMKIFQKNLGYAKRSPLASSRATVAASNTSSGRLLTSFPELFELPSYKAALCAYKHKNTPSVSFHIS